MSKKKVLLNKDLAMDGKVDTKFDPSKSQKGHLTILRKGEYKKVPYLLQKMGDAFQFIAFWQGNWYQGYTIMHPENKKGFTQPQMVELAVLTQNFMETTVDTLVATKERDDKEKRAKCKKKVK